MRLRADFWVAAFLRRTNRDGVAAVLRQRGHAEAGAVYIKLDCLDGRAAVFGPAPQADDDGGDRRFMRLHKAEWIEPGEAELRLGRERSHDDDLWIIEVENREGTLGADLIAE